MQEQVSRYKPGDKVNITYLRNEKESTSTVSLKNSAGNYDVVKAATIDQKLGAELVTLDTKKAKEFGIDGGVVVKKIGTGVINDQTRMKDGFVILKVNNNPVKTIDDLVKQIGNNKTVTISGFYPGYDGLYEYPLSLVH
jgi:serine protease Do